jgi:hypothetical protein
MPRTRIAARIGLAAAAAAGALVVVLVAGGRSGSDDDAPPAATDPISATATFSPRVVLFGDTLSATVDVVLDRGAVDPDGVEIEWAPAPWRPVAPSAAARRDSGTTTHLRRTFVLRCLSAFCVPVRDTEEVDFEPARVGYEATVGEGTRRLSLDVPWPTLVVHKRVGTAEESGQRDALAAPWRADTVSLPAVSYRVSPGLLLALLVVAGVLFLTAAVVIAYRALPEREPPPEPEPEPEPVATPLEQALELLEAPAAANGAQDRRRALELVAEEVERWGENDLAQRARTLAWSEDTPEGDETRALAARLRSLLERTNGVPA